VLFDDVGFGSFGCYGAEIATPTIDARTSWSWRTASRRWNACSPADPRGGEEAAQV